MRHLAVAVISIMVATSLYIIFFDVYFQTGEQSVPNIIDINTSDNFELSEKDKPILVVKSGTINLGDEFDFKNYVKAYTRAGRDISSYVVILRGTVDTQTRGVYTVSYKCLYDKVATYSDATYIVD